MTTAILFVMLFAFMLLGMPIAIALGLSSLLTILFFGQDSLASLSLKLFETSEHFTLLAIPFFILSGAFLTTGGGPQRLTRFPNAGTIEARDGARLYEDAGSFTNEGVVSAVGSGSLLYVSNLQPNAGVIQASIGGSVNISGDFTNSTLSDCITV